jgi:hypothetical protein
MANGHDTMRLGGTLAGTEKIFLGLGIVGAAGCVASFFSNKVGFFASYLTAFAFFLALSLGAMFFVMVQHVARCAWSVTVRRIAETSAANLQWMAVLSIPLFLGVPVLFAKWWDPSIATTDHLVHLKAAYLNQPFFILRNIAYFAIWFVCSRWLFKTSVQQDESKDPAITLKLGKWSCLGLILFALTQTFWAFDWIMTLNPHWFSTMFGVYYFAGAVVAQYCFLIIMSAWARNPVAKDKIGVEHFHDLGKLLFGHNVFWTYIGFSQFMLIWYANIPEETIFFHMRAVGSWKTVSLLLPWCHFAIPFLFLMSHNIKRKMMLLVLGSIWLLVMCYVDIFWLIQPNFYENGAHFGLSDISSILGIGGIFMFLFVKRLKSVSLIAVGDPRLHDCLTYDNGVVG